MKRYYQNIDIGCDHIVKERLHLVLLGFMGTGKTSTAKELKKIMHLPEVDMDEYIVRKMGLPISEIFDQYGEGYFRQLETEALKEVLSSTPKIISTGGGVVEKKENWQLLNEKAVTVSLFAQVETIAERLKDDRQRPLLANTEKKQKISQLLSRRYQLYQQANLIIWTDHLTPSQVAEKIASYYQSQK